MIYRQDSLLSQEDIDYLFNLYRNSTNVINNNGYITDRHMVSTVGHFLLSSFTNDEFFPVWNKIKEQLSTIIGSEIKLIKIRILKYNKTCFIPNHLDTNGPNTDPANSFSLIAQLNDPSAYIGGTMLVSDNVVNLKVGDAVIYTYDHYHEVNVVNSGVRYVLNLRFDRVK